MLSLFALLAMSVPTQSRPPIIRMPAPTTVINLDRGSARSPSEALRRGMIKLRPQEAVMKAADSAPRGVYGVFELNVKRAEKVGSNFFLNSERDYRDQRNVSVALGPQAQTALRERYGGDLPSALLGKKVLVYGYARRVRVDFVSNGKRSGKYYYQTHVPVGDARQLELAD